MNYLDDLDQEAMDAFGELNKEDSSISAADLPLEMKQILQSTMHERTPQHNPPKPKRRQQNMTYLFKLSPPLTPIILASAAIFSSQPNLHSGEGEHGTAQFCEVTASDIPVLKSWLAKVDPSIFPTFVPMNKAFKDLSPYSIYLTLGIDTTLPQYRPDTIDTSVPFLPRQDLYPLWYFFYGTLADSSFLAELFCTPVGHQPTLLPAIVKNGALGTWGGKYNALVDSLGSKVEGWAYEIVSRDEEDILRAYETAVYEVVRVEIELEEGLGESSVVKGCTFRFAGDVGELD